MTKSSNEKSTDEIEPASSNAQESLGTDETNPSSWLPKMYATADGKRVWSPRPVVTSTHHAGVVHVVSGGRIPGAHLDWGHWAGTVTGEVTPTEVEIVELQAFMMACSFPENNPNF